MVILVSYDVNTETKEGRRRLRLVAKACLNFGQRVQKSVFECTLQQSQYEELERTLVRIIDQDLDSLRFYRLMEPIDRYRKQFGSFSAIDFNGPLVL